MTPKLTKETTMAPYPIDVAACRSRQGRLLELMDSRGIDTVVVLRIEHVQWLAGPRLPWVYSPAAALCSDGRLTLVCPNEPAEVAAADRIVTYEAQWHSTLRNDQPRASAKALIDALPCRPRATRVGIEFSVCGPYVTGPLESEAVDIEPDLLRLRRRKDQDELARLSKAIVGTEKMYQRARQIIRPGINELEVFSELQSVAVEEFGEMLTGTGNDYQCGSPGGPPRNRRAKAGELYILDLGPAFRGYFADNARTIAVTEPSSIQQQAWEYVMRVFEHVERNVRPGVSAQQLFHQAQAILDQSPVGQFNHHLGHGIGLFPHEAPHLNPHWDDVFEVGDVFTVEPGLYDPDRLCAGMRIENNYRVTEDGVMLLSDFPRDL